VENDFLAVELVVDHHVQVVLFLSHVDGHIDALTDDLDGDGLAVILVFHEERELL
jgi:hypothetical protein